MEHDRAAAGREHAAGQPSDAPQTSAAAEGTAAPGSTSASGPLSPLESLSAPPELVSPAELGQIRSAVEADLPRFLDDLRALVSIDCGSYTKAGVDDAGRFVARFFEGLGAELTVVPDTRLGDTMIATFAGSRGPSVLLIGHLDTVFEPGTAAERPFRIDGPTAYGPGVSDMKAGLLGGLYAIAALRRVTGELPFRRLVFVANPDEEIGSPVSTPIIREQAAGADACLVLECGRENGDIVSARKGMFDLRVTVTGRSAHAGVEPEKGRSAIVEAAHQVLGLAAIHRRWPDVTCNVGVIAGGSRPNVVADACVLEVDVRAETREHLEAAEAAIREVAASRTVPDTSVEIETLSGHPPMEKGEGTARLVGHATRIAAGLGFALHDAATGGASDANTTAGLGIPTLDGLGPIGGNDHSPREFVDVDSIGPRTALVAALLLAISRDPELGGALELTGPAAARPRGRSQRSGGLTPLRAPAPAATRRQRM